MKIEVKIKNRQNKRMLSTSKTFPEKTTKSRINKQQKEERVKEQRGCKRRKCCASMQLPSRL